MAYTISVNPEHHILEVVTWGEETPESLEQQLKDVVETSEKEKTNKVLIDVSKGEKIPSATDLYFFMSTLPRNLIYAMVFDDGKGTASDIKFSETVSKNVGIQINLFNNKTAAIKWLVERKGAST